MVHHVSLLVCKAETPAELARRRTGGLGGKGGGRMMRREKRTAIWVSLQNECSDTAGRVAG